MVLDSCPRGLESGIVQPPGSYSLQKEVIIYDYSGRDPPPWTKAEFDDDRFRHFAILALLNAFHGPEGLGVYPKGHAA